MENKSVEQLKITEICQKAGINRSTFYSNYANVNDMLDQLRQYVLQSYAESQSKETDNSYLQLLKHIQQHQATYRLFFKLKMEIYPDELRERLTDYPNYYTDYDIWFEIAGTRMVIEQWVMADCPESPEEINDILKHKLKQLNLRHHESF
ncbi:TetR/AcrR family transcriptional regulator [Limosilactobacillus allomucosae]|uniref:TetR/AcrR family transcriptional regulator n=1 Tax=Limosilactobacillus allomucosae TaxID=3142938 RepID=UPI0032630EF3